jgi:uncharacterized damage-inducible protein DinB
MADRDIRAAYLRDVLHLFANYKSLGDRALAQTPDEHLHTEIDEGWNSIAIIVRHVSGNFRSRFRDFLTTDGEKPDRNRDGEFRMPARVSRDELVGWWNEGWAVALDAIKALTPEDLDRTITIRGEPHLVMEALNRSVTHASYHVGQIVYLARHFAGRAWTPLTIPKDRSALAKGSFRPTSGHPG